MAEIGIKIGLGEDAKELLAVLKEIQKSDTPAIFKFFEDLNKKNWELAKEREGIMREVHKLINQKNDYENALKKIINFPKNVDYDEVYLTAYKALEKYRQF